MNGNMSSNGNNRMQEIISRSKSRFRKFLPVDTTLFFLQFIKHPTDIGSLTPSSHHLADAMTRHISNDKSQQVKKRYLEVGAGTGAFTKAIIQKLTPQDCLDVIEINPKFCERLRKKYADHKNVFIYACSVLDWMPDYRYDAIVSSLPFNAFKAPFVSDILNHYQKITNPGGYLSFCEYMALPEIRKMFLMPKARKELQATLNVTYEFEKSYEVQIEKVFANFPPANVHHCQF